MGIPATSSRVRAADQVTPLKSAACSGAVPAGSVRAESTRADSPGAGCSVAETIIGSSLTETTAAKPTPKRPVEEVSSILAEARSVDNADTPAASSGVPVLAAVKTPSRRISRSRPGSPARAAASAAFWASSMTTRSR
jgi:hypothetical protein